MTSPFSGALMSPISIQLGNDKSKPFKSIDKITWSDVPPFAILTGVNGSGKTQFLQALIYKLTTTWHQQYPALNDMSLEITGEKIGPDEVAYLPSSDNAFRIDATNIGGLHQAKFQFLQRLQPQNAINNIETMILRQRIQKKFGISINSNQITQEEANKLPDDYIYMLEYSEVSAGLSHVFVGYQVRRAELLMDQKTENDVIATIGRPPWEFVNEALESVDFGYRIVPPENRLMKDYQVRVTAYGSDTSLDLNDLSSGEKTILRTILWFYNSKHNNIFPKLFILDEPDAHLHPSMTRQFIDILKNVLVDQYNVRVILSTHSPSTVALAPEKSLYVMTRDQPRIRPSASKADAIGLLTSGLVIVSEGTRFILVEDEYDFNFYSAIRDILADQGPSKDPRALRPAPSLVFMPSSRGQGKKKTSGGKSVVQQWVDKFDTPPLNEMFRGIIDLDDGNAGNSRVLVLGRYSVENYQLDPIIIFGLLIEEKRNPQLPGIFITSGDEHLLRSLPSQVLQSVVDFVQSTVEPMLTNLSTSERAATLVKFTNGTDLNYPDWMLKRRGHDLLPIFQRAFGQSSVTPPRLEKMIRRIRLVPVELADALSRLQAK